MPRPVTILLAEDHHLVREGLRALLEEMGRFEIVGQADDGVTAMALAYELRPDIIVMDVAMPHLNGLEATSQLRKTMPELRTIILSQYRHVEYVVQALLAGAHAYLVKDAIVEELSAAIESVLDGTIYLASSLPREEIEMLLHDSSSHLSPVERLTQREREVLRLVAIGHTNRQIAHHLTISIKTAEKHRFNLMDKLGIRDVTGLVRFAIQNHLITPDEPAP